MKDITEIKRRLDLIDKNLSKIHNCKKCRGKIVAIEVDEDGNTRCGYCHKRVDYFKGLLDDK